MKNNKNNIVVNGYFIVPIGLKNASEFNEHENSVWKEIEETIKISISFAIVDDKPSIVFDSNEMRNKFLFKIIKFLNINLSSELLTNFNFINEKFPELIFINKNEFEVLSKYVKQTSLTTKEIFIMKINVNDCAEEIEKALAKKNIECAEEIEKALAKKSIELEKEMNNKLNLQKNNFINALKSNGIEIKLDDLF